MKSLQEKIHKYDESKMFDYLKLFYKQITDAINISCNTSIYKVDVPYSNILICGMGGSSIGSEFVRDLTDQYLDIPLNINNDYSLPKYVNSNTLLIIISYSGNTEEIISCYNESKIKNLSPFIITSGGFLLQEAITNNLQYVQLPQSYPPRVAFGYMSIILLNLFISLDLLSNSLNDEIHNLPTILRNASNEWSKTIFKNNDYYGLQHPFKLCEKLFKKDIFIYTTPKTKSIGYRFKSQLSENSKILSNFNCIPEMNHNEIEGYKNSLSSNKYILWLTDPYDSLQNIVNVKNASKIIGNIDESVLQFSFTLEKTSFMSGQYLFLYYLDWVSFYLAILYETDPTPVMNISKLKSMQQR